MNRISGENAHTITAGFFVYLGSSDKNNPVNKFDFVFLLRLRYADKKSSLAELIVAQHGKLEQNDIKHIQVILNGKTKHSVLLILDGYDEYKPGTNNEIDRAIEFTIGNCFLILTCRPDLPSKEGHYVSKEIRDRMDGEVIIEGFTEESIRKCSEQYLESAEKSEQMLKQALDIGIYVLLKVPIVLLMVCVLFSEHNSLPQTRTKIVQQIFQLTVERTTLKHFDSDTMQFLNELLLSLGELSWNALQSDVQQLLLQKACKIRIIRLDFNTCSTDVILLSLQYNLANNFSKLMKCLTG